MKKYMLFFLIFIYITKMCSCTDTKFEDDALQKIQKYDKTINVDIYDYQKDLAAWLSPENEYVFNTDGDNSDNIINIYDDIYVIKENRLYFTVRSDNCKCRIGKATCTES